MIGSDSCSGIGSPERIISYPDCRSRVGAGVPLLRGRFNTLICFVHILDVPLEKKKIGRRLAVHLQRATIVPLDGSFDFFAVKQHNHHWRVRIDLLLIIEELGVSLHRRGRSLSHLNGRMLSRSRCLSAGVSSNVAARSSLRTTIGTFPGLRDLACFALHLGKRGSDEFTIAHLFLYLQKIRTDSKSIARRTFGGDWVTRTKVHSQAAAIRGEGENFTRNGKSCKEWCSCYTSGSQKAKGEIIAGESERPFKVKGRLNYRPSFFLPPGFWLFSQLSCE